MVYIPEMEAVDVGPLEFFAEGTTSKSVSSGRKRFILFLNRMLIARFRGWLVLFVCVVWMTALLRSVFVTMFEVAVEMGLS